MQCLDPFSLQLLRPYIHPSMGMQGVCAHACMCEHVLYSRVHACTDLFAVLEALVGGREGAVGSGGGEGGDEGRGSGKDGHETLLL